MRKGPTKFIEIPNNTLAKGDIIRLLPGDIAPALIELIPFDIEKVENNQNQQNSSETPRRANSSHQSLRIVPNEFTNYQEEKGKVFLNKGTRFDFPEACKPDWQRLNPEPDLGGKKQPVKLRQSASRASEDLVPNKRTSSLDAQLKSQTKGGAAGSGLLKRGSIIIDSASALKKRAISPQSSQRNRRGTTTNTNSKDLDSLPPSSLGMLGAKKSRKSKWFNH